MCKYEEIEGWRLSNGKTIRETDDSAVSVPSVAV